MRVRGRFPRTCFLSGPITELSASASLVARGIPVSLALVFVSTRHNSFYVQSVVSCDIREPSKAKIRSHDRSVLAQDCARTPSYFLHTREPESRDVSCATLASAVAAECPATLAKGCAGWVPVMAEK